MTDKNNREKRERDCFLAIDTFVGPYAFLSNTFHSEVFWDGHLYPCVACAIYATQYELTEEEVLTLRETWIEGKIPTHVKLLLQNESHKERSDWRTNRRRVMEQMVRDKFRRNSGIREQLEDTGSRFLVWNSESDGYFGRVRGSGQNHLGRILMEIREDIRNKIEFEAWLSLNVDVETDSNLRPVVRLVESKPTDTALNVSHVLKPDRPFWIIGKLPTSDIIPANPSVSRQHVIILCLKKSSVVIMDLHSTAGTFINNEKLQFDHVPYPISDGAVIRLGASSRIYTVKIDRSRIFEHLEHKKRALEQEINELEVSIQNPQGPTPTETRICVRNLAFSTTKSEIVEFFEMCGEIKEIILLQPKDRPHNDDNRANRGVAFITFVEPIGAANAMRKNESFLNKRKLVVTYARIHEKPEEDSSKGYWKKQPFQRPFEWRRRDQQQEEKKRNNDKIIDGENRDNLPDFKDGKSGEYPNRRRDSRQEGGSSYRKHHRSERYEYDLRHPKRRREERGNSSKYYHKPSVQEEWQRREDKGGVSRALDPYGKKSARKQRNSPLRRQWKRNSTRSRSSSINSHSSPVTIRNTRMKKREEYRRYQSYDDEESCDNTRKRKPIDHKKRHENEVENPQSGTSPTAKESFDRTTKGHRSSSSSEHCQVSKNSIQQKRQKGYQSKDDVDFCSPFVQKCSLSRKHQYISDDSWDSENSGNK